MSLPPNIPALKKKLATASKQFYDELNAIEQDRKKLVTMKKIEEDELKIKIIKSRINKIKDV